MDQPRAFLTAARFAATRPPAGPISFERLLPFGVPSEVPIFGV